jgi:hypothetical protein
VVVAGVGGCGAAVRAAPAPGRRPRRRFLLRRHPLRLLRVPGTRTAPLAPPIARFLQCQRCLSSSLPERLPPSRSAMAFPSPLRRGFLEEAAYGPLLWLKFVWRIPVYGCRFRVDAPALLVKGALVRRLVLGDCSLYLV